MNFPNIRNMTPEIEHLSALPCHHSTHLHSNTNPTNQLHPLLLLRAFDLLQIRHSIFDIILDMNDTFQVCSTSIQSPTSHADPLRRRLRLVPETGTTSAAKEVLVSFAAAAADVVGLWMTCFCVAR